MTKKDVRCLSRELDLLNWNKHSSSCLATRIATGQQVTREKLDLIGRCEAVLADLGFMGCRVRISDDFAVIELVEKDIALFLQEETRLKVVKKMNDFGLARIFLDLDGRKGITLS